MVMLMVHSLSIPMLNKVMSEYIKYIFAFNKTSIKHEINLHSNDLIVVYFETFEEVEWNAKTK